MFMYLLSSLNIIGLFMFFTDAVIGAHLYRLIYVDIQRHQKRITK